MATTKDYIEYVCERLHGAGGLRYRKMFGEYMVYVNDKPVLLVCDNTVFVKIVPELAALMADAERGLPYEGALYPRYRRYRPRTAGRRGAGDGHAAAEAEKEEGRVACQRRAGVLQ